MARRARCEAVRSKQRGEDNTVNDLLREEGAKMLNVLLEKVVIFLEHARGKIISEENVNDAFKYLQVKTNTYHAPADNGVFPMCETHRATAKAKAKAAAGAPRARRGNTAVSEIEHENRPGRDDCVYFERYPFARLVREIVGNYKTDVKISASALSWIQFIVENHLIGILKNTCALVKDISKSSGRVRVAINVKDVRAVCDVLRRYVPVMNGTMPDLPEEEEEDGDEDGDENDDDDGKPARATAKGRAKKKTSAKRRPQSPRPKAATPRATAAAKAKAKAKGGRGSSRKR